MYNFVFLNKRHLSLSPKHWQKQTEITATIYHCHGNIFQNIFMSDDGVIYDHGEPVNNLLHILPNFFAL
jgi:hypothetical protein